MINPQKPVINPIKIFNRFTALERICTTLVLLYIKYNFLEDICDFLMTQIRMYCIYYEGINTNVGLLLN